MHLASLFTAFAVIVTLFIPSDMDKLKDRKAYVAGKFYPDNKTELNSMIKGFYQRLVKPTQYENVWAIIVPHAGYIFSGQIAASAFNQVNPNIRFENIFVIAPSHQAGFNGASVYAIGNYQTPLGIAKVNTTLAQKLIESNKYFNYPPEYHNNEHSLEVQVPFIQQHFNTEVQIVPIIIGTEDTTVLKEIARTLKPWFNKQNLFVISSDFSHYPDYNTASKVDENTANAIVTKDDREILKAIKENFANKPKGLATSACGIAPILTLIYLCNNLPEIKLEKILYQNSGDTQYGDKQRVVGYWSIKAIEQTVEKDFDLTMGEKEFLLTIARKTIESRLLGSKKFEVDSNLVSENLKSKSGAFVSLHIDGKLRGCIGRFTANEPLYRTVQYMAISAAFSDPRFAPLKKEEICKVEIEISVLSPMKLIKNPHEIELGKHGIYIKKGLNTGTFLPQVASQTGWNIEEFLGHCSRDKAGLNWDGWKTAEVYIYTALVFNE